MFWSLVFGSPVRGIHLPPEKPDYLLCRPGDDVTHGRTKFTLISEKSFHLTQQNDKFLNINFMSNFELRQIQSQDLDDLLISNVQTIWHVFCNLHSRHQAPITVRGLGILRLFVFARGSFSPNRRQSSAADLFKLSLDQCIH